ncbi:hypothetical protein JCGZ_05344 [Jatropha curcas]|uniref:RING-type E3 ubiquitin transferase n=1 Tax=Jatropha curcas TaxID=180498 RepID=A0A067L084_JATCU|nr:E3 ubiquitin-protein ligase ORTHRUS 2 [Jatropha curcas]KDP37905.1 hypothetical protein JCGZ_05344 [Jatropha curcas]
MAHDIQLPCDGDDVCMKCKAKPPAEETLTCSTCITPWHVACLSSPPETLASTLQWECPDCSGEAIVTTAVVGSGNELVAAIKEIEADAKLTEKEKARKRQELMSGKMEEEDLKKKGKERVNEMLIVLGDNINCSFCMQLPERPVTTPCGHNFCLKCFEKWIGQRKFTCAKCRKPIPAKMASQPRINATVVSAIRMARMSNLISSGGLPKIYHFEHNQNRPDKAYTTERAQKAGKANACSGKIFVTVPPDHFGPIPAENDPERNQGVLVGECWEDRLECRQWGAHLPHVAGIAGQSNYGAQSVALSGGYIDDEDHGEWFLYTGSGGRDLSGNKRTNKEQSFDQKFEKMNEALRLSCKKGYPVRVVRSHKEKRSSYAPEKGVRYDGVYRIEKCWRKVGIQGHKVCRYLFVRCDNEPAPWTSDANGDRPRPLPVIKELDKATDITERKESPSWDFDEEDGHWKWKKPPPVSRKPVANVNSEDRKRSKKVIRQSQYGQIKEKLLREFSCKICHQVLNEPATTTCGHNFCKSCLEGAFAGQTVMRERSRGGRTLRAQRNVMKCPYCSVDISDFLQDIKVNRELMNVVETLQCMAKESLDVVEDSSEEDDDNPCNKTANTVSGDASTNSELQKAVEQKNADDGENAGSTEASANNEKSSIHSLAECSKPQRVNKKKKVESGDCSIKDEKGNKISAEKTGDGNSGEGSKPVSESLKRKNGVETIEPPGAGGVKTRKRRVEQETADGNDSPSSPLHVRSSDDF